MYKKLVVYVPVSHANALRSAIAEVGGGKIGNYSHCSFSVRGVGRFIPEAGAHPAIGEVGKLEAVEEERIEVLCEESLIKQIIREIKKVHPYEAIAFDVYAVEDMSKYE